MYPIVSVLCFSMSFPLWALSGLPARSAIANMGIPVYGHYVCPGYGWGQLKVNGSDVHAQISDYFQKNSWQEIDLSSRSSVEGKNTGLEGTARGLCKNNVHWMADLGEDNTVYATNKDLVRLKIYGHRHVMNDCGKTQVYLCGVFGTGFGLPAEYFKLCEWSNLELR